MTQISMKLFKENKTRNYSFKDEKEAWECYYQWKPHCSFIKVTKNEIILAYSK